MRTWAPAIVAVGMVTGCNYGPNAFNCTDSGSCGAGGTCQPNMFCSFPDASCDSGQRYGDLSGTNSGRCVGDEVPGDDAGIDSPPDARVCFGTSLLNNFNVCLAAAPTTPLMISADMQLNTDNSSMCTPVANGGTGLCVIAATTISIDATLRATGTRPLVLIASDSITVTANGAIDVASHRGANPEVGAGGSPPGCSAGTPPTFANSTSGGGAGGSFAGLGGKGGSSGGGGGTGGMPAPIVTPIDQLRGGCPGQDGEGGQARGLRGNSGGAVLLIAANTIDHAGIINAAGEGGSAGQTSSAGGGGGGSGGMIVLDAQAITGSGLILANGGGGGEGSGTSTAGQNGSDPTAITAAPGGAGGSDNGGDGGAGSAGIAGGAGGNGANGAGGGSPGGGGGGGGGAGLIKASVDLGMNMNVSPAPTP